MNYVEQSIGVMTGDSRDNLGRSRFHCFNPETHVHGGYPDWYLQYDKHGAKKVFTCSFSWLPRLHDLRTVLIVHMHSSGFFSQRIHAYIVQNIHLLGIC